MIKAMICHDCPKLCDCFVSADHCARVERIEEMICKHMPKYHMAYKMEQMIYDAVLDDDNTAE